MLHCFTFNALVPGITSHTDLALKSKYVVCRSTGSMAEVSVNNAFFSPNDPSLLVVCNRSPNLYVMKLDGEVVQTISSGKRADGVILHREREHLRKHREDHPFEVLSQS